MKWFAAVADFRYLIPKGPLSLFRVDPEVPKCFGSFALRCLKARRNTRGTLWSARERVLVALSAEQERHTKCVSRFLKAMWNTFSACLSRSAENATEAISLALHSVSHRLKSMWNTMECKWDGFSGALGGTRETHWERVSHALNSDSLFEPV